jgi:hypothetical protein
MFANVRLFAKRFAGDCLSAGSARRGLDPANLKKKAGYFDADFLVALPAAPAVLQ